MKTLSEVTKAIGDSMWEVWRVVKTPSWEDYMSLMLYHGDYSEAVNRENLVMKSSESRTLLSNVPWQDWVGTLRAGASEARRIGVIGASASEVRRIGVLWDWCLRNRKDRFPWDWCLRKWKDWSPWELVLLSLRLVPWWNSVGAL